MENLFLANKYKSKILVFKKKAWIPSMISLSLMGCGSPTSIVKDSYIDDERQMTTSQLLDNRKICSNIEWNNIEDKNKRKIVEYKCTFVDTKDFLAKVRSLYAKQHKEDEDAKQKKVEEQKNKINAMEKEISNLTLEASSTNSLGGDPTNPSSKTIRLESESEKSITLAEKKLDFENKISSIQHKISVEKEKLSYLEEELEFLKKADPNKRFPKYEKIVEIFQWVVNKNDEPQPLYGELIAIAPSFEFEEIIKDNGDIDIVIPKDKVLITYRDPKETLIRISKTDTKNHATYIQYLSPYVFLTTYIN